MNHLQCFRQYFENADDFDEINTQEAATSLALNKLAGKC